MQNKLLWAILISTLLSGILISACSTAVDNQIQLELSPLSDMPMEVQNAPRTVQEAYRFATANPDLMKQIPCYCGCGALGHTSNYDCYVSEVKSGGEIIFDNHSLGCSICVDITQDSMRLLREGKSAPEIRTYIDNMYSKYGTSNLP
ncbi:MAG: PCYCGC motif-containing (lipo)protein [Chloroflexota bacterium]|nr:MAG: hypothetical protein KatS3mg045_1459 [Bellilinea sp.]